GDVFGIFLAITGNGFSEAELRRYAEYLRRELLVVRDVKKIDLFAEQQEVVFLELSRRRLVELGIPEEQIYRQLEARNIAAAGGVCASGASTSRSILQALSARRRKCSIWLSERIRGGT